MSIQTQDDARRAYALALVRLAAKANAEAQPMTWLTDDAVPHAVDARKALHRASNPQDDEPMPGQTTMDEALEGTVEPAPGLAKRCACGKADEPGLVHSADVCMTFPSGTAAERLDKAAGLITGGLPQITLEGLPQTPAHHMPWLGRSRSPGQ